ncbi:MAG TPA: hypothetical protein VIT23_04290 [Terrimicrobiaceae bacterium]
MKTSLSYWEDNNMSRLIADCLVFNENPLYFIEARPSPLPHMLRK